MTKDSIIDLIKNSQTGEYRFENGIVATLDRDNNDCLEFHYLTNETRAFLIQSQTPLENTYITYSLDIKDAQKWVDFVLKLTEALEITSPLSNTNEVIRYQTDEAKVAKYQGTVEAYEKLLLKRDINITN